MTPVNKEERERGGGRGEKWLEGDENKRRASNGNKIREGRNRERGYILREG